jgi:glycosyltransferase involved in cell wall biosynthesis
MENPLVSVIIPTYNGQEYVEYSVDSVLTQSYQSIEIIIINDGSSDGTANVLERVAKKDNRIKVLSNEKNKGFVKALNIGIQKSKGVYIARLDDDDRWSDPKKLEKQMDFLKKNPEYVLVGGGVIIKNQTQGTQVAKYLFPEHDKAIRDSLLTYNVFSHSSVVFLKNAFEKVGGYDEKFGFFADADLWLKMGMVGKLHNLQEYFTVYLDKEAALQDYSTRDKEIRRRLFLRIAMKWRHRKAYPHFAKALLFCIISYLYSFLPYKARLKPFLFKVRTIILGTPYKYFA